jgi:hypothetical protein
MGNGTQWFGLQIPPLLASCLTALRLDDKPRHIWIEILCSDRSNSQERDDQPFMFHSIFAAAERVCAWVDEGDANCESAINFIKTSNSTYGRGVQKVKNPETEKEFERNIIAVFMFLSQPWFCRRWIIQEVAWAQRCTLYCGRSSLSWEELSEFTAVFSPIKGRLLPWDTAAEALNRCRGLGKDG